MTRSIADFAEKFICYMFRTPPPLKTVFHQRREREFLYLHEVDAVIAAMEQTRYPTRNKAIAIALFCQCLQPSELCWLRRADLDLTRKTLYLIRNRELKSGARRHKQINLQFLCPTEVALLLTTGAGASMRLVICH